MKQLSALLACLATIGLVQQSAQVQAQGGDPRLAYAVPPGPSLKHLDGQKLVFVVNGLGDSTYLSDNLLELSDCLDGRLRVQAISWTRQAHSHQDFTDHPAHLRAACRLAGWARLIRRDCPAADIYFVGHSAGARIVLAAAEMMPEQSVNRIFLFASGVSSSYDLRPALRASRSGIDHFWSSEDDFLERIVEKRGTSEGGWGYAAGRVGFYPPPWMDARDRDMYRNVRQYNWHMNLCGNGGHNAWLLKHNLRRCMVPLMFQPEITVRVAPPKVQTLPAPTELTPDRSFSPPVRPDTPSIVIAPAPATAAPPALALPLPAIASPATQRMPEVE